MTKLKMHSKDLTQDNIEKIRALFPNCVSEAQDANGKLRLAVDFDLLKQELSDSLVEGSQERYRLDWPGKREAMLLANSPIAKTVRPVREESVEFDTTENLFIEGDNLEALKLLQENYLGKVKMIYMDPPYNTGNDFVYNDDFAESSEEYFERSIQRDEEGNRLVANTESNGRYHSDWLSMMLPRLKLARNLLSDDGVIFISIDDNEVHNLRKLCDEIFGYENQVNPIVHNKLNSKNDTANVQRNHEYVLCYRKSIQYLTGSTVVPSLVKKETVSNEVFKEESRFYIIKDPITTRGDGGELNKRKNLGYSVYYNEVTKDFMAVHDYDINLAETSNIEEEVYTANVELLSAGYTPIRPPKVRGKLGAWTWGIENFNKNKDEIIIYNGRSGYSVRKREFVDAEKVSQDGDRYYVQYLKESNSRSIIEYSTNDGTTHLSSVLEETGIFSNPKNQEMLKYLISLLPNKDFLCVDFFAGSSTTAHAVMQLNAEDGGNRKFIMVQLPEEIEEKHEAFKAGYKTIAEISKERIRRAGKQILEGECHENWNKDVGFRVLKVDSTNMKDVYYRPDELGQQDLTNLVSPVKEDRSSEDLLFQVMLDLGLELHLPIQKQTLHGKEVFFVDGNLLVACFDQDISEELVLELTKHEPLRVVFADSCFGANDSLKTNAQQIFKQQSPDTRFASFF